MAVYSDIDSVASPTEAARGWFWFALTFALAIHLAFFVWSNSVAYLAAAKPEEKLEPAPPPMRVERVQFEQTKYMGEVLEGPEVPPTTPKPVKTEIEIPADKLAFEQELNEVRASPAALEIDPSLAHETPREIESSMTDSISKLDARTQQMLDKSIQSISEQISVERPRANPKKLAETPGYQSAKATRIGLPNTIKAEAEGDAAGPIEGSPGFSDLNELLSNAGPMSRPTAQIMMPADLLFGYDSFQIQPAAYPDLQKLAMIIRKNPAASIRIEGYSDTFGTAQYNVPLSMNRALAVKNWLVVAAGVDPGRITTDGRGSEKLLAPSNGSIEQQQLNRRVEIILRNPR